MMGFQQIGKMENHGKSTCEMVKYRKVPVKSIDVNHTVFSFFSLDFPWISIGVHPIPPPVVVDISSDQPTIRVGEGVFIRQGQL